MKKVKVLYKVDRYSNGSKALCVFTTDNKDEILKEILIHIKDEIHYDYDSLSDDEIEEEGMPTLKELEEFAMELYKNWEIEVGFNMFYMANDVKII